MEYRNVKLARPLADRIDALVERHHMGYRSRQEAVSDAVRRFLQAHECDGHEEAPAEA